MRRITMEMFEGDDTVPKRGDRLISTKSIYYVLHARRMKRREPSASPKFMLFVERQEELELRTIRALIASGCRRGGTQSFEFRWNPRKKKTKTFEQYLGGA